MIPGGRNHNYVLSFLARQRGLLAHAGVAHKGTESARQFLPFLINKDLKNNIHIQKNTKKCFFQQHIFSPTAARPYSVL
ncbi:MAG: hypothetical protein D3910_24195 [Candidatus Electrothrix sp. ATG2]|nr:hypothetical protein [Candidatus Electrothrix sp. ATG2]